MIYPGTDTSFSYSIHRKENSGMNRKQKLITTIRRKWVLFSIIAVILVLICIAIPLIIVLHPWNVIIQLTLFNTTPSTSNTNAATIRTSTARVTTVTPLTTKTAVVTSITNISTSPVTNALTSTSSSITPKTINTTSSMTTNTTSRSTNTSSTTIPTASTLTTPTIQRSLVSLTNQNDVIIGLYGTTAGGSTVGTNGVYSSAAEEPYSAIDANTSTKYLNFGSKGCAGCSVYGPGIGTGFFVIPSISNATIAQALIFASANDNPNRDPMTVSLEGSKFSTISLLHQGASWTLIYNGSTGMYPTIDPGRSQYVLQQNFTNTIPYASYRILITSQRGFDSSVQYAEARVLGYT